MEIEELKIALYRALLEKGRPEPENLTDNETNIMYYLTFEPSIQKKLQRGAIG